MDETRELIVRLISLANLPPPRRSRQRLLALVQSGVQNLGDDVGSEV